MKRGHLYDRLTPLPKDVRLFNVNHRGKLYHIDFITDSIFGKDFKDWVLREKSIQGSKLGLPCDIPVARAEVVEYTRLLSESWNDYMPSILMEMSYKKVKDSSFKAWCTMYTKGVENEQ